MQDIAVGDQADELRDQINESLLRARETLAIAEQTLRERSKEAVVATEEYVQNNPWQSVAIAAGVMKTSADNGFQPSKAVTGAEAIEAIGKIEALAGSR